MHGGDRPKNLIDLGTSRDGPMASTSAVVQDAGVDVQTAVQHFWTLLSMLLGILPIRKLRTRSIIIFFTHQRTSEGIIKLMISQRKMIIGGRKGSECSLNSENSLTSALNTSVRSSPASLCAFTFTHMERQGECITHGPQDRLSPKHRGELDCTTERENTD